jgi:ubiquinone/menaquinone biosynthesis C-methylase UbiE
MTVILRAFAFALLLPAAAQAFPEPTRPVAGIVSPDWSNEAARDKAGEAKTVMRLAGIKKGMTVADIGAGGGYYTVRVAPKVGAKGLVIAQDITPAYLDKLKARVRDKGLTNVHFVLGKPSDPMLPAGKVDVALMIHMYHEIAEPYALLWNLRGALKPGGRIAIVDLDRPAEEHGMPKAQLTCEVKAVGYVPEKVADLNPGYIAVFRLGPAVPADTVKACLN